MNRELVDKLARAMLYEGYVLYPYRPSVKNSHRWTFGGIYPKAWADAQTGSDASAMQTEVLISGTNRARVHVIARFLHLTDRKVGELLNVTYPSLPLGRPLPPLSPGTEEDSPRRHGGHGGHGEEETEKPSLWLESSEKEQFLGLSSLCPPSGCRHGDGPCGTSPKREVGLEHADA